VKYRLDNVALFVAPLPWSVVDVDSLALTGSSILFGAFTVEK